MLISITNCGSVFYCSGVCRRKFSEKKLLKTLKIPTIGIGASKYCDGQILVTDDMIGLSDIHPKFVKQCMQILRKIIEKSVKTLLQGC